MDKAHRLQDNLQQDLEGQHNSLEAGAQPFNLLEKIAALSSEPLSVEELLFSTLQYICSYMAWPLGHVCLADPGNPDQLISSNIWEGEELTQYAGFRARTAGHVFRRGLGLPGMAMEGKQPQVFKNLGVDPRFLQNGFTRSAGLKIGVVLPVLVGEEVVAVLEFFTGQVVRPEEEVLATLGHISALLALVFERQRTEDALRHSEERFRIIFQNIAIGIELVDLNGNLLACNPAIARIFGYTLEEIYTTALLRSDHAVNIVHQDKTFERLRLGQINEYTLERVYRHKDGHGIWGRSKVSLVRDASGIPQYAVCLLEEITDQKQMEIEMREMQRRLMESREAERLNLAQDLHDGPIQDLYGLTYTLKAFADHLPQDLHTASLKEMEAGLQQVTRTLRSMSGELRPPTLVSFGLEKALRSHADDFKEAHPELEIRLDLMHDGQKLPENVRLALYRIYQASLTNVLRHSGATRVDILLEYDESQVRLEMSDNGKGFVMPSRWIQLARKGHLGLIGARERAEAVGGKLEVESEVGVGTRVRVRVPLGEGAEPKKLEGGGNE
jgi:PAS domain S-box-containing protein